MTVQEVQEWLEQRGLELRVCKPARAKNWIVSIKHPTGEPRISFNPEIEGALVKLMKAWDEERQLALWNNEQ